MVRARVLLVDDGPVDETVSALRDRECRVTAVESVSDALVNLRNNRVDIVVTEYQLPDGSGLELLAEIRESYETLPVVLYTAHGDEHVASEAIDAGVSSYIPKDEPPTASRLAETVSELTIADITGAKSDDLPTPTTETIIRAVDEAPIGITISDPSLPDNPMVYINEAYEELTGYDAELALGRNCRFLQGPDTEEEAVAEMREAIEDRESVDVEVVNYREDGTPFWNHVTIAPLFDDDGNLTHYVGFQNDVTDRKEAEAVATQRADSLREERQALERVLGRISGLVNETSQILVNSGTRAEIEREVCAEIAQTDGYSHAWIGQSRATGAGTTVSVDETGRNGAVEMEAVGEWSAAIFEEAIEQGTVQVVSGDGDLPASLAPSNYDASSMAVVPLTYRRATYGVLAVYADRSDVLDRRECKIFEALGQMIASGINAVETKQVLTADRVTELGFEITDDSFPLIELAQVSEGSVSYNGSTLSDDSVLRVFVTMSGCEAEFEEILAQCETITDGFVIAQREETLAASVEIREGGVFRELAEYGATLRDLSVSASSNTAQLHIDLPVEGDVRSVLSELESVYDGVNLVRQHERERDPRPTAEFVAAVADRLTDRQYTALETAYLSDYFEFPRPVSGEELAASMDISRQTYHQHLRAAQRKLLEEFFETE
ncbi:PAS domain-containing protein [Halovenus sp. WSH3]|uniref:PAS domain-containing protein n=1 Tax=Halovenus carboxidivorans TaxID=2692199 RepID=A0A6B0T688_9EURY|nr:PAS domain-containing protein [Halovenus carboxidivorans]